MTASWLQQRLRTHIVLRLVVATVLLGSAFVVQVRAPGALPIDPFFFLIGVTFAVSLPLIASLRMVDRHPWVADVHFALDALLVSAGVWLTGGVESLFTTLYVLPIVAASTVQLRRGGLQVATLSAILFIGVVVVQYGALSTGTPLPIDAAAPRRDLPAISVALYTIGFNVFGFFAVALLSGSLAERAQRADVRLERATEQIADLQAFNQYVLDNLLSGLATADAQNRLLTFNRFAMVITGRTGALPIGESAVEVLQLPPEFTAALGDLGRVRTRRTDFEYRRADGRTIDLGLSVAALPLPDAGRGYLYTFQDVTETKRIERSARLQQRLAAIGEMAAGIAHEIRNPLASMSGSMQMLRQELPLSDDQAQLMDIVLKESERLNQTIKSFLAYARPQKLRPQALDLRTLVLETATLLRNSAEVRDTHTVEARAPETGVPMEGDESQIRQIIWNLATNGLRAMPDGGRLRLSALEETAADGQRLSVLEVADQGVGIPAEEIELVFQPFRGSFGRGTGLGLAIVHRLVTDNHGRIDVQSAPGRGTTFTIRFARLIGRDVPPPVGSASVLTSSA